MNSRETTPRFVSPPPAPPQSRIEVVEDKLDEDEEDEILTVDADGQVEIHSTSRMSNRSSLIEEKTITNELLFTEVLNVEEPVIIFCI